MYLYNTVFKPIYDGSVTQIVCGNLPFDNVYASCVCVREKFTAAKPHLYYLVDSLLWCLTSSSSIYFLSTLDCFLNASKVLSKQEQGPGNRLYGILDNCSWF